MKNYKYKNNKYNLLIQEATLDILVGCRIIDKYDMKGSLWYGVVFIETKIGWVLGDPCKVNDCKPRTLPSHRS